MAQTYHSFLLDGKSAPLLYNQGGVEDSLQPEDGGKVIELNLGIESPNTAVSEKMSSRSSQRQR